MPYYDYHCNKCNKTIEIQKTISDATDRVCETCNEKMVILIGTQLLKFKGTGFYETDYVKKQEKTND